MKVFVAVLSLDGFIRAELAMRLLEADQRGWTIDFEIGLAPVDYARNLLVKKFLKTDCEWLVQLDDDVAPPQGWTKFVGLLAAENKLCGYLPYPWWKNGEGLIFAGGSFDPDQQKIVSPTRLNPGWNLFDAVGGGGLVTHRSVFEQLEHPHFAMFRTATGLLTEDYYFALKCREANIPHFAHSDYVSSHFKTVSVDLLLFMRGKDVQ